MIYAIDFGTSNSLLAAADGDKIHAPIPLDPLNSDASVLRSLLFFPNFSKVYYGAEALQQFQEHQGQGRLIRSIKKYLPMRSFIGTWIDDRPANLEDLISFFLKEMRKRANLHFGQDVESVVLGRPAKFSEDEGDDRFAQSRLEVAAQRAGFKHIHFFAEPIAAACEFRGQLKESKIVLVGDFGGGTSDFSVIRMDSGPFRDSDVLSIGGVSLAGDALDGEVMRHRLSPYFGSDVAFQVPFSSNVLKMPSHLMEKICSPADISLLMKRDVKDFLFNVEKWAKTERDRQKIKRLFCLIEEQLGFPLFEAIEKSKRGLSENNQAPLQFSYPGVEIEEELRRPDFEHYVEREVSQIMQALDDTVKSAGLKFDQVDVVCCTGGTAKVPMIHQELVRRFGLPKIQQHNHFHSVVQGLATRAKELQ